MAVRKDAVAAAFFQGYLSATEENEVADALKNSMRSFKKMIKALPRKKIDYAYAEGKWTIRELLQHLIDAERVFAYRALWFARKDPAPLPGFDENNWATHAKATNKKWKDLVMEFELVHQSTEMMFESFDDEQLLSSGIASDHPINVIALGFIAAGHLQHHINIIYERYL